MALRIRNIKISGPGGLLRLLVLQMKDSRPAPGVLWIHGGGFATGMPEMAFFSRAIDLVKQHGCTVVSPAYRLSLRAPYPAALEDCWAALLWLRENAAQLNIRDDQIMVGGESAGGGLAAALCLYARDKGGVNIAFQMPLYPMIDDRDTESSRNNHAPVWNTKRNHAAWKLYLKGSSASPYAAPARADDLRGLPPAYSFVGDIEPFYCETIAYFEKLRQSGVEAHADVYPGCFHAFDMMAPWKKESRRAAKEFNRQFAYAAARYFAPQD